MGAIAERTAGKTDHLSDRLGEAERATLASLLAALEVRDADTYSHSERSVRCGLLLGRECGLGTEQMLALEVGALLHDIGKIGVPDSVLRKPGKLDPEEWATMRRHPDDGQRIVRGIGFLADAMLVVVQHHEWWDGTGYPLGLNGEEIDLNARILAVADAFDAMTSDRVYRPAKSYEAAVAELDRCAGRQFDPQVVAAFRRVPRKEWEGITRRKAVAARAAVERIGTVALV